MILAVDVGNSRMKWLLGDGSGRTPVHAERWRDADIGRLLDERWGALEAPDRIVVANVAGPVIARALRDWARSHWGLEPWFVETTPVLAGLRNGYRDHRQLGVDRWLGAVAAWQRVRGAACVVDCGTATTINVIAADGEYRGGLIAPGVNLMQRALAGNTAQLPLPDAAAPQWPARSTGEAIITGSLNAAAGGIERALARLVAEAGQALPCLVTGGEAALLLSQLPAGVEHVPDLVLQGVLVAAGHRT